MRLVVEPALVAGVLEHRQRLAAVVDQQLLALELVPAEVRIRRAPCRKKPSFSLIWAK
jgi:hypothetical protein